MPNALRDVDLNLLVALEALLEEASVTRAAERLGKSVPGTSHALGRLRDTLGDPLLVRAGRSMVRTARAEALRPALRDTLARIEGLLAPAEAVDPATLTRTFTLHVTDHVLLVLGARLEERLGADAPHVSLAFGVVRTESPEALRAGRLDAAIGVFPRSFPELRRRLLFRDRLVCAVREGHPEVGATLDLPTYARLSHVRIAPRERPGGIVDTLMAAAGYRRRVARSVPYFHAALHLAATTDHVVTASKRMLEVLAPTLGLRILEPPLPFAPYPLALLWHPRRSDDPAHRWLRDTLAEVARDTAPEHALNAVAQAG
ncbi:MAG: LysR family transcriptional regulator [Myxococcota bacterium]